MALKKDKALTRQREIDACKLRVKGKSYDEIANELGFSSPATAYNCVKRALDKTVKESAGELITLSTLELERLTEGWAEQALTDPKAARLLLEIYDRRVKLLNVVTDKVEVEHTHKIDVTWDD